MSSIEHSMQFPTTPYGKIYISGPAKYDSGPANVSDIQVGMIIDWSTTNNGFDRVDAAANQINATHVAEVPILPTGSKTDPMSDYVYEQEESVNGLRLQSGTVFHARCKDDSNDINYGDPLDCDTTNQGMVKKMADEASVDSGSTTVLSTAANGAIISGVNVPKRVFRSLTKIKRSSSSSESWLQVEVVI